MDRDEALRLLRGGPEGIAEWNRRRSAGEDIPDLGGADLGGADLREADLSGAVLSGANLGGDDLREVNLGEAVLSEASLCGADLGKAHLFKADLDGADLDRADLSGADLDRADLSGADLGWADLSRAYCSGTIFADLDLSEVKGLESVRHGGPSTVGIDTIFRSGGKVPEVFLQGCGVPDVVIANIPALVGALQPIQFYSCFISYSHEDEAFAQRLHSRMRDEGLRVWFAPGDVQGGKRLHERIDHAIRIYDKLLLVLSEHSMKSEWVAAEIGKARQAERQENRRKLFPIRLVPFEVIRDWECFDADSGQDLGVEIREHFIPDFTKWKRHDPFEKSFARLLSDLKTEDPTAR